MSMCWSHSGEAQAAGVMMKGLGQHYLQYVNRSYRRSGIVWEGRFRSCLLQQEAYLLACQRYVELNPVRAGILHSTCGPATGRTARARSTLW